MSYKPEFMLLNWSKGEISGCGTEEECREQLKKCASGSDDSYIIAEVRVLSEMKRIET